MLVCYLDDSGKDPQNPVTTLAGYAARDDAWEAFEETVEPIFEKYEVPLLHTIDLHNTENAFEGWSVLKKQSFIAQVCRELAKAKPLAVSMSVRKQSYASRTLEIVRNRRKKRVITAYSFAFNAILNWLLTDIRVGKTANEDGIAFIVESGNEHNNKAKKVFDDIRVDYQIAHILRSLSFVHKDNSRAIQMADLFAYYSRRHAVVLEQMPPEGRNALEPEPMLKIVVEGIERRSFVATDFHEKHSELFFGRRNQTALDRWTL